jgi:uncharacterized protein (DUF1015 family)
VYTRARATYDRWRAQGVLIRDPNPALYAYHQTFTARGKRRMRKGFIAALGLTPFDEGVVLPHERTHAGPKEDRLRLLRSLEVNTGQVFALYSDPQNRITALLDTAIAGRAPDIDATDTCEADVRQQVWIVSEPSIQRAVACEMAPKRNLIIADGHHRYETALTYRDQQRPSPGAWANYCMATLVSMEDKGLVILPTHREVYGLPGLTLADVLSRAAKWFTVTPVSDLETCTAAMAEHARLGPDHTHAFGLYAEGRFQLLVLRDCAAIDRALPVEAPVYKSLDVSIAHTLILERLVGLPEGSTEQQDHLRYHRDPQLAVHNVDAQAGNLVLLLNPTRIDQVKACAEQGIKMPQKSTDFYPKMVAGLTMMPLREADVEQRT